MPVDGTVAAGRPSDNELDALASLGPGGNLEIFGRRLPLTNLDKVLFPAADGQPPVSKREFIRYAACIAPVVLPYLAGRALNMHRFPGGADTSGFWHKQLPGHAPAWIPRWDTPATARPAPTWSSTSPRRLCGRPTPALWNGTPGPPAPTSRTCPAMP